MKRYLLYLLSVVLLSNLSCSTAGPAGKLFSADHPYIQYTGRIDFTDPGLPRFWQPGVYITARFKGTSCDVILNDEVLWGKSHNYLEIVIDGKEMRLQTTSKTNTIHITGAPGQEIHTLVICKNTEANIGYLEFAGIRCEELYKPETRPLRRMEFIGNSITCGMGSDASAVPCGKGVWEDQHSAYLSYGALTARAMNAEYHLSSVSGIGLVHSCCNLDITMPQVFDKVSMRNDTIAWDFNKYRPDVLTICLGQNDGIQDSALFCDKYIAFIDQLRVSYPTTTIICLTSPMADENLGLYMKRMLVAITQALFKNGDKKVLMYAFARRYHNGCDNHPDLAEHRLIAAELIAFLKKTIQW